MVRQVLSLAALLGAALLGWWLLAGPGRESAKEGRQREEFEAIAELLRSRKKWRGGAVRAHLPVPAAAFSADGKFAAGVIGAERLSLWELPMPHQVWTAYAPTRSKTNRGETLTALAFSPDGKFLLSGDMEGPLQLWDAATGKQVRVFPADEENSYALAVAFSSDGREVLAACTGGRVVAWNVTSGKRLRSFDVALGGVADSGGFGAQGSLFLAIGQEFTAQLWRTSDGRLSRNFALPGIKITDAALSPTGRFVLTADWTTKRGNCTLRLWEVASGRQVRARGAGSKPQPPFFFSPDQRHLFSGGETPAFWDLDRGGSPRFLVTNQRVPRRAVLSPNGRQALLFGEGELRLWNLVEDEEVSTLFWGRHSFGEGFALVSFSPDGKRMLAVRQGGAAAILWDLEANKAVRKLPILPTAAALTPGGRRALLAGDDGTLTLWDLEAGKKVRTLADSAQTGQLRSDVLALSADTRWAARGVPDKPQLPGKLDTQARVSLWDLSTGKKVRTIDVPGGGSVRTIRFLRDGKRIVAAGGTRGLWDSGKNQKVGGDGDWLSIWELSSGKQLRTLRSKENSPIMVAPDGRHVLLTGEQKELRDLETGKLIRRLNLAEQHPKAILRESKLLLSLGQRLTSLKDGKLVREFPPRYLDSRVWVGASPDGKLVWFEQQRPYFRLYDAASGREITPQRQKKAQR